MRATSFAVLSAISSVACAPSISTAPYPISATAAVEHNDLEVSRDLEVRSASYSVTGLTDVDMKTGTNVQLRPLLTVYAVRRSTGEQLVLIYEDLTQRKQPSKIIRLVPAGDSLGGKGGERE